MDEDTVPVIKIICVVGARPNFPKIAPIVERFASFKSVQSKIVHTGQHYDYKMSQSFFDELQIPKPDYFLDVGSGTHVEQTAKIMLEFEKVLLRERPDCVLVVGDVNSTLACALTASKMGIKLAHVEAGLRSYDRKMPEEINRVIVDSISDYLFCTEQSGIDNLNKEKAFGKRYLVGNVMIDTVAGNLSRLKKIAGAYGIVTFHRPSNVEKREILEKIIEQLNKISQTIKLIWPLHPRAKKSLERFSLKARLGNNVDLTEPMTYINFMSHVNSSKFVITDSGGVQEETSYLKIPCFTVRRNTERPVTIEKGTNSLVKEVDHLSSALAASSQHSYKKKSEPIWDGNASKRIVDILLKELKEYKKVEKS